MTALHAKAIWERAVEPVRRTSAQLRCDSAGRAIMGQMLALPIEMLGQVRLYLTGIVKQDDRGVLAEISRELIALKKEAGLA